LRILRANLFDVVKPARQFGKVLLSLVLIYAANFQLVNGGSNVA
jgi:hypothetical protein